MDLLSERASELFKSYLIYRSRIDTIPSIKHVNGTEDGSKLDTMDNTFDNYARIQSCSGL